MIVKLLTERHLEFLSLKGGCTGSSESTLVKMSNCWKSRALAHIMRYVPIKVLCTGRNDLAKFDSYEYVRFVSASFTKCTYLVRKTTLNV